jgi:hypothetical protein
LGGKPTNIFNINQIGRKHHTNPNLRTQSKVMKTHQKCKEKTILRNGMEETRKK